LHHEDGPFTGSACAASRFWGLGKITLALVGIDTHQGSHLEGVD